MNTNELVFDTKNNTALKADNEVKAVAAAADGNLVALIEDDNRGYAGAAYYLGVYDPETCKWLALGDSTQEWGIIYRYITRDKWVGGKNENKSLRKAFDKAAVQYMGQDIVDTVKDEFTDEEELEDINFTWCFQFDLFSKTHVYTWRWDLADLDAIRDLTWNGEK